MALDSMKTLEERARDNYRAIDNQWIAENESKEISDLGLQSMDVDADILDSVYQEVILDDYIKSVKNKTKDDSNSENDAMIQDLMDFFDSFPDEKDDELSHGRSR